MHIKVYLVNDWHSGYLSGRNHEDIWHEGINPMANEQDLLVQVAKLYYETNLTQAEIGKRVGTSRSTVSRLLNEAREKGIVQITINYPWERDTKLEYILKKRFGLSDARVLRGFDREMSDIRIGMGRLAAECLDEVVADGVVLGVSYGRSIANTIEQINTTRKVKMTVVQIIGALGSGNPLIEGPDLARELANKYGAQYRYLYAPLVVEDQRTRDLLLQEPYVHETLTMGKQADAVIIGIGALEASTSGLIWTGYLNQKEIAWLRNKGAVGHMCAKLYDAHGEPLDVDLNRRTIAIEIESLRRINTVIAVAGGSEKARAILGAIRGRFLNVLITDDQAAEEILKLAAEEENIELSS